MVMLIITVYSNCIALGVIADPNAASGASCIVQSVMIVGEPFNAMTTLGNLTLMQ